MNDEPNPSHEPQRPSWLPELPPPLASRLKDFYVAKTGLQRPLGGVYRWVIAASEFMETYARSPAAAIELVSARWALVIGKFAAEQATDLDDRRREILRHIDQAHELARGEPDWKTRCKLESALAMTVRIIERSRRASSAAAIAGTPQIQEDPHAN